MKNVLNNSNDSAERKFGQLQGYTNELERIADSLSDSQLKAAVRHACTMLAGGFIGYGIDVIIEAINNIGVLL